MLTTQNSLAVRLRCFGLLLVIFPVSLIAQSVTFSPGQPVLGGLNGPRDLLSAALGGSTFTDIAVADTANNRVRIAINGGIGGFSVSSDVLTGAAPRDLVAGDFDGDGDTDLAVACTNANTVEILRNLGGGIFGPLSLTSVAAGPRGLAAADVDLDGDLDLAVACSTGQMVQVLINNGTGTFVIAQSIPAPGPRALAFADLTLDGSIDLAIGAFNSSQVHIHEGNNSGTFVAGQVLTTGPLPGAVRISDLNGDGEPDISTANFLAPQLTIFFNNGGILGSGTFMNVGVHLTDVVHADFDVDGDIDLGLADIGINVVHILTNQNGTFGSATTVMTGSQPDQVVPLDINGDFVEDLATVNFASNDITSFENTSAIGPILGRAAASRVTSFGSAFDALFVNGETGGVRRRVSMSSSQPLTIDVLEPSDQSGGAPFILSGFIGIPNQADVRVLPAGIGEFSYAPLLLSPLDPRVFTLANSLFPDPSALVGAPPATWTFATVGLPPSFHFALQGILLTTNQGLVATNGVLIEVL